jgi:hypothetical protein
MGGVIAAGEGGALLVATRNAGRAGPRGDVIARLAARRE